MLPLTFDSSRTSVKSDCVSESADATDCNTKVEKATYWNVLGFLSNYLSNQNAAQSKQSL